MHTHLSCHSASLISLCVHPPLLPTTTTILLTWSSEFRCFPPSTPVLHVNLALILLIGSQSPQPPFCLASFPLAAFYISLHSLILKQSPNFFLIFSQSLIPIKCTKVKKWAFETVISGRESARYKALTPTMPPSVALWVFTRPQYWSQGCFF